MYEIFVKLLKQHNVTAYKVSKATGIAGSTFTDWKNGRSVPKQEKLQKIADFFGVTVDYLLNGKEPEQESTGSSLEFDIMNIFEFTKNKLTGGERITLNGKIVEIEKVQALISDMEKAFEKLEQKKNV